MSPAPPPVSIVLPVHDGARWLAEAIDSVLAQTFGDFELLVVDDGSTDASGDIARSYDDPRVRVVANDANLGVSRSANRGLELAAGELVARMDADDVCVPDRLARQVAALAARPDVAVLGGAWLPIDGAGRVSGGAVRLPTGADRVAWTLWFWNCVAQPTTLARREALLGLGGYRSDLAVAEDYDLWLRALVAGLRVDNLADVVLRYRRHAASASLAAAGDAPGRDAEIAARHLSALLGRAVSTGTAARLREPELRGSAGEARAVADALGGLAGWALPTASPATRRAIRRTVRGVLARQALRSGPTGAPGVVRAYRRARAAGAQPSR